MNSRMVVFLTLVIVITLLGGCATAPKAPPPLTVQSLSDLHQRKNRVATIAHHIFIANQAVCPNTMNNYGFTALSLNRDKHGKLSADGKIWAQALHIGPGSTITTVIPHSAADRAGLQVGDTLLSINKVRWPSNSEHKAFYQALNSAVKSPSMQMTVSRQNKEYGFLLVADKSCDADIILTREQDAEGFASNSSIVIGVGLEQLLEDDNELAFVIAHELAHIILGHTAPEKKKALEKNQQHSIMEQQADTLGIRLMVNAGYNPEAAVSAIRKLDEANRGPVAKWLDLHGAYLPTEQRIQFVRKVFKHQHENKQ